MRRTLRTPEHHVLADIDGRPTLVYDLERTQVFPVIRGRQVHDAQAVAACLREYEVVTASSQPRPAPVPPPLAIADVCLDIAGTCNMGCKYCFEADIGARRGPMSERTVDATIEAIFARADRAGLIVQFASGEALTAFPLLTKVVEKFVQRARAADVPLTFGLTTNATLITPAIAAFLAEHAFRVKVSLDGPPGLHDGSRPMLGGQPSYERVTRGLALLVEHLPKTALTVNTVVHPESSLGALWQWARALPVGTWVTIPMSARAGSVTPAQLEQWRCDLETVADDIASAYEGGREIIGYDPLLNVVRKLAAPAPMARYCGAAGSFIGVRSDGDIYPCLRQLGLDAHRIGDVGRGLDDSKRREYLRDFAPPVDRRPACRACWSRYLCGGGCYADSIVYGEEPSAPLADHCAFFRLQIETGLRLYDRLRHSAPLAIIDLFGKQVRADFERQVAQLA